MLGYKETRESDHLEGRAKKSIKQKNLRQTPIVASASENIEISDEYDVLYLLPKKLENSYSLSKATKVEEMQIFVLFGIYLTNFLNCQKQGGTRKSKMSTNVRQDLAQRAKGKTCLVIGTRRERPKSALYLRLKIVKWGTLWAL